MAKLKMIIEKLEAYKEEHAAKLAAWEGVTLEKKTSGEEFAQMGRALTGGAKLAYPFYENTKLHPQIIIYTCVGSRYVEDSLYIYGFLDEHKEKEKDHEIRRDAGISRSTFIFTPDEVREAIKNKIAFHSEQVASYTAQIKAAQKAFESYQKAIEAAERDLKNNCGCSSSIFPNSLYYAIKDACK